MNPDFISVPADGTVGQARARVRASELSPQQLMIVCVLDDAGALVGAVSLPELLRADQEEVVSGLIEAPTPTVAAEADLPEVARVMTDYNLIALPVLDGDSKLVGVIGFDDVLELLLPEEWRRRAGTARS
jgi:Mg/Co/Ni transporter MgtE